MTVSTTTKMMFFVVLAVFFSTNAFAITGGFTYFFVVYNEFGPMSIVAKVE